MPTYEEFKKDIIALFKVEDQKFSKLIYAAERLEKIIKEHKEGKEIDHDEALFLIQIVQDMAFLLRRQRTNFIETHRHS